jgi:hypothetical protein
VTRKLPSGYAADGPGRSSSGPLAVLGGVSSEGFGSPGRYFFVELPAQVRCVLGEAQEPLGLRRVGRRESLEAQFSAPVLGELHPWSERVHEHEESDPQDNA